jgi:ketosteroid isomerase-like protein
MSEENVGVARQRITARRRRRRRLHERFLLRFPVVLKLAARAVSKMPPGSRLRRRILAMAIRTCFEAFNRGDHESAFALYHADVETTFPAELATVGYPAATTGRRERINAQRSWNDIWEEFRNEPEELVDLGDQVLVLGRLTGSGLSSGVGFDTEVAYLFDVSGGFAIREEMFVDQALALEAAGLSE